MNTFSLARTVSFVATAALLAACTNSSPPTLPDNVEEVGDGVYLFKHAAHRSLFMVTDEGVIVTDPLNAAAAREYRTAIGQLTDQPVRYVVYSHYHWDRVSGGEIFKADGAQFVAQARCIERFEDNPNPNVVMPDISFDRDYQVSLGGRSLDLHYFGPSHGDCLTVMVARPANLIQIVDLVEPPRAAFPRDSNVPYIKPHNLRNFFANTMELVNSANVNTVLASHVSMLDDGAGNQAESPATAPVSIIADQAQFWEAIYDTVEKARDDGNVGIDSFVKAKAIDTALFEGFDDYREEDLPIIMRRFVGFYDMGR